MACRCAIVATDLPSAVEWIRHEETGLAVKPRDADGLVEAICRFVGDAPLRSRVGEAAEKVVRAKADHDRNMTRVEDIYYALAEGRSPAAVDAGAAGTRA